MKRSISAEAKLTTADQVEAIFHRVFPVPELSTETLERLRPLALARSKTRKRWSPLYLPLGLLTLGVALAALFSLLSHGTPVLVEPSPPSRVATPEPAVPAATLPAALPALQRTTATIPQRRYRSTKIRVTVVPPSTAVVRAALPVQVIAPNPRESLADEASELGEALNQLHRQHDPEGALATLVIYRHQFPMGTLRQEATLAEVDANLTLGRKTEALNLLEGLNLQAAVTPRVCELQLLRAELLSDADRCPEAMPTFETLLHVPSTGLQERSWYDRASCRALMGDPEGSRADYRQYLQRFPQGRFAMEVQRRLNAGK